MFVMPVISENVLMSRDGNDGIVHLLLWYTLTLLSLVGGFECAVFFRFFAFRNKGKPCFAVCHSFLPYYKCYLIN